MSALRAVLALVAVLALAETRSCGFTPEEAKDEGEPCTRSTECRDDLQCRGGVCMVGADDGDAAPFDADAGS